MATFSLNNNTKTQAVAYPLNTYADINYILNTLPDNEIKLINPSDIRDCILSLYSASTFKLTTATNSTIEYIGLDTFNPNGLRDIKLPMYFGKRAFSGTYSYVNTHDILSTFSFSNTESDFFFFNTKKDSIVNSETKISILAGTAITLHNKAPYMSSEKLTSRQSLSLNFVNPSIFGDINLTSDYSNVSVNEIIFPTIVESTGSASEQKTLFYQNGKLIWDDIRYQQTGAIGNPAEELNIFGTPTNINGYSLLFSDDRVMPVKINDMVIGTTFSEVPVIDILKKILYPYLPPLCSIRILPPFSAGYSEIGTYPTPTIEYTIIKRTEPTLAATLTNMIPGVYGPISTEGQVTVTSTSNGVVITPISTLTTTFSVIVNDGIQTASASTSIQGIYPYFYGFSSESSIDDSSDLATLTKLLERKSDKLLPLLGSGNLYFVYDKNFGTLSNIYDGMGNTVSASFSYTSKVLSSPSGLWASKEFWVYKWANVPQVGPPESYFLFKY